MYNTGHGGWPGGSSMKHQVRRLCAQCFWTVKALTNDVACFHVMHRLLESTYLLDGSMIRQT